MAVQFQRVYAFVDGGQFREGLKEIGVPWQEVNVSVVAQVSLQWVGSAWQRLRMVVSRVFIYDAVRGGASGDEVKLWLERNDEQADVHVRLGQLAGEPARQKGVDVRLAVDALTYASNDNFDVALLITGDGDFAPVAEAVRDKGPLVAVCAFRGKLSDDLRVVADRVGYLPEDPKAWESWALPPRDQ